MDYLIWCCLYLTVTFIASHVDPEIIEWILTSYISYGTIRYIEMQDKNEGGGFGNVVRAGY